jgi:hypothetical protein
LGKKDCPPGSLPRRPRDIEKVFGKVKVTRSTDSDYLHRATIKIEDVELAMNRAIESVSYENFKSSVKDKKLHDAYLRVWSAMSELQNPRPYSTRFTVKR